MGKAFFITGTDTGVGKTHAVIKLAGEFLRRGKSVGVMKPISCGPMNENDALICIRALGLKDALQDINPICLKLPLSPYAAAKLERKKIDLDRIFKAYGKLKDKYDILLVEGAGGALVPIKKGYLIADLIKDLGIPAIIVARAGLGTINHTLLTVEALRKRKIVIDLIVLNGARGELAERTNPAVIRELTGIKKIRTFKWED